MTRWEIVQKNGDHFIPWAHLDNHHEAYAAIKHFMDMKHPEDFFLVDHEHDKMLNLVQAYVKLRNMGGYES